jgi:hypothetical protein
MCPDNSFKMNLDRVKVKQRMGVSEKGRLWAGRSDPPEPKGITAGSRRAAKRIIKVFTACADIVTDGKRRLAALKSQQGIR